MADEDVQRRLDNLERLTGNGVFVRSAQFTEYQRAQEKTDTAQELRFADVNADITALEQRVTKELDAIRREDTQKRLLIYGAVVAALASLVATIIMGGGVA